MEKNQDKVMEKHTDTVGNGLVALNHVHSIGAKLWKEVAPINVPRSNNYQDQKQKSKQAGNGRQDHQQRRITPVQLPGRQTYNEKMEQQQNYFGQKQSRNNPFSHSGQNWSGHGMGNTPSSQQQSTDSRFNPNKKRAQIKSLPRKPPDIQNFDLFPPIGNSDVPKRLVTSSGSGTVERKKLNQANPFAATVEEANFDPTHERKKLYTGVQQVQTEITTPDDAIIVKILKRPDLVPIATETTTLPIPPQPQPQPPTNDKGRTTELFNQLKPEQLDKLKKLSSSYSDSLDANLCRSILAEFTFLCQLLVANNNDAVPTLNSGEPAGILASLAPRVWFVARVFDCQLPLISNISPDIVQMLIDFYPHRLPKPLRSKLEMVIQCKLTEQEDVLRNFQSNRNFSPCVIFQNEIDGRNNFPHQKDCQDFGKQRDLFYAIREIWTSSQRQRSSPVSASQYQNTSDLSFAFAKVKQLFQMNSSPTNLSRLASLFLSQCLLDLNASNRNDHYDPSSIENVRRILESNPSKYEKLRERLLASDCVFEENQPIPDPMAFLQYFVKSSNSTQFSQHLIDHAIHEIYKLESEVNDSSSSSEAVHQMQKTHLLAQMLAFLYFLPYRDDEYKKPIGPINVEIYLQSQITLRSHQFPPINFVELLTKSICQRRLVSTLPWIIEYLCRADQVTFHLPSYKPILSLISCIYRDVLSLKSDGPTECSATADVASMISAENNTLLRFMCGKLFCLPGFPDFYLFGSTVQQHLVDYVPELLSLLVKHEDEVIPLDAQDSIGCTFLPIWFRPEMKQIMTILSANATVRGSIPSQTPGIVKHIRAIPEKVHIIDCSSDSKDNRFTGNLQLDLEAQFFQIHPSSMKKTVDFISERIASNFLKQLRTKFLGDIKNELLQEKFFGESGVTKCKEKIWQRLNDWSTERCRDAVSLLLGDVVSDQVRVMSQSISTRNANEKVFEWANHHITPELFPETSILANIPPESQIQIQHSSTQTMSSNQKASGTLFLILAALHNTIQRLHNGYSIDELLIDQILDDPRLEKEKEWVIRSTFDLAITLITFSPNILTPQRQLKFITFWKKISTTEGNNFLCPRNFILLSMSRDLKVTFEKLCTLTKGLLNVKLLSVIEIQESCMNLLRQDWSDEIKILISKFLKDLLPNMESTDEKEVIDWIAWYCSGQHDEKF